MTEREEAKRHFEATRESFTTSDGRYILSRPRSASGIDILSRPRSASGMFEGRLHVPEDMRGWEWSGLMQAIDRTVQAWCQSHDLGIPQSIQICSDLARSLPDFTVRGARLCRIPCLLRFAPKPEIEELMSRGLVPRSLTVLNESRYGRMSQKTFTILAAEGFLPICYEEQELRDAVANMPPGAEYCSHLMIRSA